MKNDGGPAFPRQNDDQLNAELGMSLRDWFAGQALPDTIHVLEAWNLTRPQADQFPGPELAEVAATRCYMYADAMLAKR